MSRRISFLICGAQKSGTSALHDYLQHHPQLDLPSVKELHLFDNEQWDWSDAGLDRLDAHTAHHFQRTDRVCGEATPVSLWWGPAMERIWRYNPAMRLIAILRNPITRAYANWRMEQLKGRDTGAMALTLEHEEQRCREALPLQHRVRPISVVGCTASKSAGFGASSPVTSSCCFGKRNCCRTQQPRWSGCMPTSALTRFPSRARSR